MAIVHKSTITPTKQELVTAWLDGVPWGGSGEVEMIGGYRFDDPAGEVGVESLLARRGEHVFQLPLTYRGAPLESGDLVTTMEHSFLGPRWVYLGMSDPVGVACYVNSLAGEQSQADVEVWADGRLVERRPQVVRVSLSREETPLGKVPAASASVETGTVVVPHIVGIDPGGVRRLVGEWDGGGPVVLATFQS